jgi:5-methylcytosine-specific restriction endonuclease McrA
MSAYLPEERDVRDRVDKGRDRARKHPYNFVDDEHLSADGVEVHAKLLERSERTDGRFCCYLCGEEILDRKRWHLDHITPLVLRGPHTADNLEAACDVCNLTKGDLPLDRFLSRAEYREFMAGGDLPPFKAMRERPTAELWVRSPMVARRFARRPREVRCVRWEQWWDPYDDRTAIDARIATVLIGLTP